MRRLPRQKKARAIITIPLMVLAVLSIVGGALNLPGLHTLTTLAGTHDRVHSPG